MISLDLPLKETLQEIRNLFIPFYRNNAQRRANLDNIYRQAEIQKLNADTRLIEEQAELLAIQAERERVASQREKIALAVYIREQYATAEKRQELNSIVQRQLE